MTSNYVYHNIPGKDRQEILLETLRTLKKGGTFAIHDIMYKYKYGDMNEFVKIIDGMKCYTIKEIESALENAGFSKIRSDHHKSKPWITIVAKK